MLPEDDALLSRAIQYANFKGIAVSCKEKLGYGSDGTVWLTDRSSVVKALVARNKFDNELECYRRLLAAGVTNICGFDVPRLLGWNDELLVIEMSLVSPPYLLDFGKVWIDQPPPYFDDKQLMANAEADARRLFGSRWPDVAAAIYYLRANFGIYYADPRPANINCGVEDDEDWEREEPIDYSEYE